MILISTRRSPSRRRRRMSGIKRINFTRWVQMFNLILYGFLKTLQVATKKEKHRGEPPWRAGPGPSAVVDWLPLGPKSWLLWFVAIFLSLILNTCAKRRVESTALGSAWNALMPRFWFLFFRFIFVFLALGFWLGFLVFVVLTNCINYR